jgi:hypothetical protein
VLLRRCSVRLPMQKRLLLRMVHVLLGMMQLLVHQVMMVMRLETGIWQAACS